MYSTTNDDVGVELGRVGVISEEEGDEYTFKSDGVISYTVDNSSPKGLTPQLVVRNVEGDIYQAGPVAEDQMAQCKSSY